MTRPTVTVSIAVFQITGQALPAGKVRFELTGMDVDAGIIAPQGKTVTLDAAGEGSIELWSNGEGTQGTQYRVEVRNRNGDLMHRGLATVPDTDCNLHEILSLAAPAVVDDAQAAALSAQASAAAAAASAAAAAASAAGGGGATGSYGDAITPAGAVDGANDTFTLPNAPAPALSLQLVRNGLMQTAGADYALVDDTITYTVAPALGDSHVCWFRY